MASLLWTAHLCSFSYRYIWKSPNSPAGKRLINLVICKPLEATLGSNLTSKPCRYAAKWSKNRPPLHIPPNIFNLSPKNIHDKFKVQWCMTSMTYSNSNSKFKNILLKCAFLLYSIILSHLRLLCYLWLSINHFKTNIFIHTSISNFWGDVTLNLNLNI